MESNLIKSSSDNCEEIKEKERCVNCGKTTFTAIFSYDKISGALKKTPIYGDFCSMGCSMEALHKL